MRMGWVLLALVTLGACTQASPVMDAGGGTYFVSTRAAPAAGGTTGAYGRAQEEATKFCGQRGDGTHPVLVGAQDRDVYQSAYGGGIVGQPNGGFGGGFSGGTNAWGSANVRFRCSQ